MQEKTLVFCVLTIVNILLLHPGECRVPESPLSRSLQKEWWQGSHTVAATLVTQC